jgi:hypothetical protein
MPAPTTAARDRIDHRPAHGSKPGPRCKTADYHSARAELEMMVVAAFPGPDRSEAKLQE